MSTPKTETYKHAKNLPNDAVVTARCVSPGNNAKAVPRLMRDVFNELIKEGKLTDQEVYAQPYALFTNMHHYNYLTLLKHVGAVAQDDEMRANIGKEGVTTLTGVLMRKEDDTLVIVITVTFVENDSELVEHGHMTITHKTRGSAGSDLVKAYNADPIGAGIIWVPAPSGITMKGFRSVTARSAHL
jgi:hypothetical protein